MLVLPKRLLHVGAGFLSARTARRLRSGSLDFAGQEQARNARLAAQAGTVFGREHGLAPTMRYADFQRKVPLRGHEGYLPYLTRLLQGEAGVLAPDRLQGFAHAGVLPGGTPRSLPVNEALLGHLHSAGLEALFAYIGRAGDNTVLRGRHLLLADAHDVASFAAARLPTWASTHWFEPGIDLLQREDGPARRDALVVRTAGRDLSLIAGQPAALLAFAEAAGGLARRWPRLECLVHGGRPLGPYADDLRASAGPRVRFHEVYAGAEGLFAVQDTDAPGGLRLLAGQGIFYEFLPLDEFDERRLDQLGARTVPLEGVRPGVEYALVLTTPAGLTRYLNGDIVRFTAKDPARLIRVGALRLQLNAFGERMAERELTDALVELCRRHNWRIVNFHVAPLHTPTVTGQARGRHEWWVELKPFTAETPTGPLMAVELDDDLQRRHAGYEARRRSGTLEAPYVRLVMPGVFAQWMQETGADAAGTMPTCRGDREIADALARIARFSAD